MGGTGGNSNLAAAVPYPTSPPSPPQEKGGEKACGASVDGGGEVCGVAWLRHAGATRPSHPLV